MYRKNAIYKFHKPSRRFILPAIILLLFTASSFGQSDNWPIGSRPAAMSNAYVTESGVWAVQHNQAGLGFYPHLTIGFHHENKFVLPEFSMHALAFSLPVKPGTIGLSYTYYGYKLYNESKLGLGFGKKFGERFAAGIQINLHHNYLENEYGGRNALSLEGGIQYKPLNNLTIGAHLFNPTRSTISANDRDTIPTAFRTGIGLKPADRIFLVAEVEKRLDKPTVFKAGMEYRLYDSLFLRAGISSSPRRATFGLGYKINKITADVAFTHHQVLGFTPHFSLQVEFR